MKIAVVVNTSWNLYNFRMNFVKALLAQGHEVHTIAPLDQYTRILRQAGCIHHELKMDTRGANPFRDAGLILEMFRIYRRVKPDVVLHYTIKPNIYGTLAAAMLRIPVINNVCGLGTAFLRKNLVSVVATLLYKVSFRFARKVFFQNPDDLKLFVGKKLVRDSAADLVPGSGIDLKKFKPVEFSRNKRFTFLMVSRIISDKGIYEYIDAIRKLRSRGVDARFQLLGAKDPEHKRGISEQEINQWIESGLIEYLGTTNDVREHVGQADCVVLPSYREGTPRTLLEAASLGKPIIATNVPGCNNVVIDGYNGLLCRLKDADDLAEKMSEMLSYGDEQLRTFGANGRLKMQTEYDESLVINKYLRALSEFRIAS